MTETTQAAPPSERDRLIREMQAMESGMGSRYFGRAAAQMKADGQETARLRAERAEMLSIIKRWAAVDAGMWHPDRYVADKARLLIDTHALIARADGRQS